MEHISSLLNVKSLDVKREESASAGKPLDPHASAVVNYIFGVFFGVCMGFEKQFEGTKKLNIVKTQWVIAFMDEGITKIEQIALAEKKCRKLSPVFIPKLGDFLSWCKPTPADLGLWTKEEAYQRVFEIMRSFPEKPKDISDEQFAIINHAINATGRYELKNHTMDMSRPAFERNYEISVKNYMDGQLKPIPKAIIDDTRTTEELQKQHTVIKDEYKSIGKDAAFAAMEKLFPGFKASIPSSQ